MSQPQPIKISDISIIQTALVTLINSFPEMPSPVKENGILIENLFPQKVSMCLTTNPTGNVKLRQYICGKYRGRYNFSLLFQKMTTSNPKKIVAEDILGKIGAWLEKKPIEKSDTTVYQIIDYPYLDDNRKIEYIEQISYPRLIERLSPNIEVWEISFYLDLIVKP
jgi:hypothetical protein